MYFIAPSATDLSGQCNIVYREGFTGDPRANYKEDPDAWKTVGHMNARGELVALDAPIAITQAFKSFEPLAAGIHIPRDDLEVMAFTADLLHTHPASMLTQDFPEGVPITLLHKDSAGRPALSYCTTAGKKPYKVDNGTTQSYRVDIHIHQPDGEASAPMALEFESDGTCHLVRTDTDEEIPAIARPLLVGFTAALTLDQVYSNEVSELLNEKMGRIWWTANNDQELITELDRLARSGAIICSVDHEDDRNVTHYTFALNKDLADQALLYAPDAQEWLDHGDEGILPALHGSLDLNPFSGPNPIENPKRNTPSF